MSEQVNQPESEELQQPKKISLAEAAKQRLAQKKQAQANANQKQGKFQPSGNQVMKSQQTKKPSNQTKKMGV